MILLAIFNCLIYNLYHKWWIVVKSSGKWINMFLFWGCTFMLIGQYQHTIDAKGRVIVPVKFREDLGDHFYITKGLDGCLFVLSENEWSHLSQKIHSMPISKSRSLQRFFFSGAAEADVDKQGRILIPKQLRDYANLEKEIVFVGTSSRAEIWDSAKWDLFNNQLNEENIEEAMDLLGI